MAQIDGRGIIHETPVVADERGRHRPQQRIEGRPARGAPRVPLGMSQRQLPVQLVQRALPRGPQVVQEIVQRRPALPPLLPPVGPRVPVLVARQHQHQREEAAQVRGGVAAVGHEGVELAFVHVEFGVHVVPVGGVAEDVDDPSALAGAAVAVRPEAAVGGVEGGGDPQLLRGRSPRPDVAAGAVVAGGGAEDRRVHGDAQAVAVAAVAHR
eukprot:CAMPEP_0194312904 /NCGR_PEP_ID=MMETSP0171-20130528/9810_1 /TAXON_ID=218684 /ORGANISM="Corethron pennatum, Strain L29A3" /LENGTH=210 /DNA_ID=CAMNT_0039067625 /DNA_START=632 /DNA_END=1260 /DNA_ORIENTATION=+